MHLAFAAQLPQSMMTVGQEHLSVCLPASLALNMFIVLETTKSVIHYNLVTDSQQSGILEEELKGCLLFTLYPFCIIFLTLGHATPSKNTFLKYKHQCQCTVVSASFGQGSPSMPGYT